MEKQYEFYGRISNKVFYTKDENGNYTENGSYINMINDNKLILILNQLYIGRDLRNMCYRTIDSLLEDINYRLDRDSRKDVKNILIKLKDVGLIDFECENIKSTSLLRIDVSKLVEECNNEYIELADDEIKIINNLDVDIRTKQGLYKLYLYIKSRVYKEFSIDKEGSISESATRAEATYQSYEYISLYTGLGKTQISKYIKILQKAELLTVDSCGFKYKDGQKDKTNCENIFICNMLMNKSRISYEMEIAKKQYCYIQRQNGYHITSK